MISPLLSLNHQQKVIFRMSLNPETIIRKVELGTSRLNQRIMALNAMCDAGYPVGILLAPVIFVPQWKILYAELISHLADTLSSKVKKVCIYRNYFYDLQLCTSCNQYRSVSQCGTLCNDKQDMTGRGRGKYWYKEALRIEGETFLREQLKKKLNGMPILYVV